MMLLIFLTVGPWPDVDGRLPLEAKSVLNLVESVRKLEGNCTPGNSYTLYLDENTNSWEDLAKVATRSANLLSKLISQNKNASASMPKDFLFSLVRSHIENDDLAFGSAVALDDQLFTAFAPYAYKNDSAIITRNLADWYNYSSNDTEWFYIPKITPYNFTLFTIKKVSRIKDSDITLIQQSLEPRIKEKQGHWTKPYYDCGGGNIWMITYSAPILLLINENLKFGGVVTIDINLSHVDINQCDVEKTKYKHSMDKFRGTHRCHETTICQPLVGEGFRRGTYVCICKDGYYFPNVSSSEKAFKGYEIEEMLEILESNPNEWNSVNINCLTCSEGCDKCDDDSPCMVTLNPIVQNIVLAFIVIMVFLIIGFMIVLKLFKEYKVIKSASPIFLNIMCLGMMVMSLQGFFSYYKPNKFFCTANIWSYNIGFFMSYSALLLKTWRIAMVFKVKSSKTLRLPDKYLLLKLTYLMVPVLIYLIIWTFMKLPGTEINKNSSGLKFIYCSINIWEYIILLGRSVFLLWGIYLCFKVRKAPSCFNESKFINLAIYNTICMSNFIFIIKVFIALNFGPDLLYILQMLDLQIQITITGLLIFAPKIYLLMTGKGNDTSRGNESQIIYPTSTFDNEDRIKLDLTLINFCNECRTKVEAQQNQFQMLGH